MKKEEKIYDKNGVLLKEGDTLDDGSIIKVYWDEWYITGNVDMWKVEQFSLEPYKDGVILTDFEKSQG